MRNDKIQGDNSSLCLVCGEPCLSTWIVASVDDGRPPKTPHRWRQVGIVHESCENTFNTNPYQFVKQK